MTAKRWFIMLFCAVIILTAFVVALNILVDPFSVFGDHLYDWYSYGMTNNPKAAKYTYIDNMRGEYDAFVIGPSGSSGFSTDVLEKYTGLRWYNMFHYGTNLEYSKKLAEYLLENHHPKQLLLCLPAVSAVSYSPDIPDITYEQPLKPFWRLRFLFANPKYSTEKIKAYTQRSYIQQANDVFIAETGEYNKTRRDAEAIGSLDSYLAEYPEFVNPYFWYPRLEDIDECVAAVADIVEMCKRNGTELTIVAPPMMSQALSAFKAEDALEFYSKITEICGFWSFIASPVDAEPRYFYDSSHFRNNVGQMMVAEIFGDTGVYKPDDFGVWVTKDNVSSVISEAFTAEIAYEPELYTKELPILLYHHITDEGGTASAISAVRFQEHMRALWEAGYTAISLEQARDYVLYGYDLPESSVLITFDDGYMSNYTEAFPVLRDYDFHAVIFVIGSLFGKSDMYYKDTDYPLTPHFGAAEATEMVRSGVMSIQSHSYNMHLLQGYDEPFREGVSMLDGESEQDYIEMFRNDYAEMRELLRDVGDVYAFSYPYGVVTQIGAIELRELGTQMTFAGDGRSNTLIKGLPQSLLELKRLNMSDGITGEKLISLISS